MKKFLLPLLVLFMSQHVLVAQEKDFLNEDNGKGITGPLCGGVERWAVKVLTDVSAPLVNYSPMFTTLDSLIHIPTIPDQNAPRMVGIEFQSYVIKCKITIKKNEDDNDYHLVLKDGTETMIGEVPDPVCAAAASSAHVDDFIAARNWVNLNIGVNPNPAVDLPFVDITGVAFVDPPHGQTGRAPNGMEIHPILNIHFSDNTGTGDANDPAPAFRVSVNPSIFTGSTHFLITSRKEILGKCRLEIYSPAGVRVSATDIPVTGKKEINYTFSRTGLANGMYIYRIFNDGEILYEGKIIIQ